MRKKHNIEVARLLIIMSTVFVIVAVIGLSLGIRYINSQLLKANQSTAMDIALIVENNFEITDEEVEYMKNLTFNEMEIDSINLRLMDIGNEAKLNTVVTNVYIVAELSEDEIKYTTDEESARFFGYDVGTKLNGIWLLNGTIDGEGEFIPKVRDDICRYTKLTQEQEKGIKGKKPFGEFSSDAWGNFITGYAPVYTVEGNFVGLLGIDIDPDKYQASAKEMIITLCCAFVFISITIIGLFLFFYFKYTRAKESRLYFDFYSRMSHDMRTPMNGILGLTELSKDEMDVNLLHDNLKKIHASGKYMLELINDTLDVQKLDAGKLNLDPKIRSYDDVMTRLMDMIRLGVNDKEIQFKYTDRSKLNGSYILVDELRIEQIFMNLASNAIKFTKNGGSVSIDIECENVTDNCYREKITVTDTGIGMSKDFIKNNLFKAFSQEKNSVTTQYGGSGLGLSIVKSLVELMNGTISAESTVGEGTTFTVYLDIVKATKDELEKAKVTEEKKQNHDYDILKDRNILVFEDNDLNAEIIKKMLEKVGCNITVANNGEIGLEMFKQSKVNYFDVILMDVRMPVMGGIETTKNIRSLTREDAESIPIIAVTANAFDQDIRMATEAGMNDYLSKPVDGELMYEKIIGQLI